MEWPWERARRRRRVSAVAEPPPVLVPEPRSELERVVGWRTEVLVEAGYPLLAAANIACDVRIDLHRAVELLRQGCPPAVAAEILT